MLVHELLEASAARTPDAPFLLSDCEPHTFADIDDLSSRIAFGLRQGGVRKADRVALVMENSPSLVAAMFGVLKAGAVFVPINPLTRQERLAEVMNDCQVRAVIASAPLRRFVAPAIEHSPSVVLIAWDAGQAIDDIGVGLNELAHEATRQLPRERVIDADLAAIIYTSGSTGAAKGVMLTHRNVCNSVWSISTYLDNVPNDIVACVLPMSFGYGLFQVLAGASVGYSVLLETSFAFPYEVMERVSKHRVTGLPGVPTMFSTILQMPHIDELDLTSIRYLTNAAAELPVAHVGRLQRLMPNARIFCMYGLTECTRVSYLDPERLADKPGSVGKAIPNTDAYVVMPDGRRAEPGEIGELVVRGSGVMLGYWGKPEETAAILQPGELCGERLLHTGDLFRTDEEGYLYWVGRRDDVFKSRGEKVAPSEIESAIYELDGVAEVAVVGVPHDVDGMAIKAFVVPRPGGSLGEQDIRRHCRARLANHLAPRFVEFRSELPRTPSGKIRKAGLT
jgi:amino acid adenylation domain-containing protein